jgi:two-component system sensor histidine kinase HydH
MRVGLVTAMVALAVGLLGVVWASHQNVRSAMHTVIRGEASALYGAIRNRLVAEPDHPVGERLAGAVEALASDHLRFVALIGPDGVEAQAGTSALDAETLRAFARVAQRGVPVIDADHDRARVLYPRPRSLRTDAAAETPLGEGLVIELYPAIADELAAAGRRTLAIGIVAALALIALTVVLVRWSLGREAAVRAMEEARHLAALGQMSAVLAHEIRNPLASLKGNAQLLAASLGDGEKTRGKADRVVDEALRLEHLTNDLLEFAREGQLHVAEVDPAELARDAAAAVAAGRVRIAADDAPRSWPLDPARMRQVLINLIENAVELSEEPVELTIARAAEAARAMSWYGGSGFAVAGARADRALLFAVADRGPGIPEGELARVFEPFFTTRTRGTGLGLAVARRLVELHGGTIRARTRDGGGTVFEVTVPR